MRENETLQLLPSGPHGMGGHSCTGSHPAGERHPDGCQRRPVPGPSHVYPAGPSGSLLVCNRRPGTGQVQNLLPPNEKSGLLYILAHGEIRHQGRRGRGPIFLHKAF